MTYKSNRHYKRQHELYWCVIEPKFILFALSRAIFLFLVMFLDGKRDTGPSKLHSFHFPEEDDSRDGNLSRECSLHFWLFLFLLPPGWSGQACRFDHRKPWILRTVSYGEIFCSPPPIPPARYPKMTPDPFACLYQAVEVRNSDESLWLCVYTPESRKEGNQPRSAKSGEVRGNSCSAPELQWFTSARPDLSHVISTAETFDQHKPATVTALSTGVEKKKATWKKRDANSGVKWGRPGERSELCNGCFHIVANLHLREHVWV